jgi:pimeloyl-ACP methyl ester carboxylesterase
MNAYFFGTRERRLFGVHEAPRRPTNRAVVLCYPLGDEYIHAHRTMRQLAKMLTAEGMHTFRFDYYGTGDSDGDTEFGDFDGWETDIQSAITEVKDTTGATQVSLVGLRLGATLAANVAIRQGVEVSSLVLWDAVVSGAEYLVGLQRAGWEGSRRSWLPLTLSVGQGRGLAVAGVPLTSSIEAAIMRIDLAAVALSLPQRTLLMASQALNSHASFQTALDQRQAPLAVEWVDSPPGWIEWPIDHPMAGSVPVKALHKIVQWLA